MGREKEEIVINESSYVVHSKQRALKKSVMDGISHEISRNAGDLFMTPFALALGANSFHIGLLSSFSSLLSPFGQVHGSKLMEKYPRKRIAIRSKIVRFLLLILMMVLGYVAYSYSHSILLVYSLIFLFATMMFFQGIAHPAWFSWMGDLVPAEQKGRYFSNRNRIAGIFGLSAFILAAFLLEIFKDKNLVLLGFVFLFGISAFFTILSGYFLSKVFNPQFRVKKGYYFSFFEFIKQPDAFSKLSLLQMLFYFSIMISAPFFAVYMLEDLGFNYLVFTAVTMSSTVFYLIFVPLAGKFSDEYGNVKLIYVSAFLFPLVPLLWVFLKDPLMLIFIPGLISGIANAAFIIGVTNFTYDALAPQKRGLSVSYSSLLTGIGMFFGGLLGGLLTQFIPITFIKPVFFSFILSSVLMAISFFLILPRISEVRQTKQIDGFRLDFNHPFKMVHSDVIWFKNFIHSK